MNYVTVVWHTCNKQVFLLQKRVGRVALFSELGWIPFYEEEKISKCCILYRRIQNNVPDYLINTLTLNSQFRKIDIQI